MISFPVIMKFTRSKEEIAFEVSGDYGWDLNNKLFVRKLSQ